MDSYLANSAPQLHRMVHHRAGVSTPSHSNTHCTTSKAIIILLSAMMMTESGKTVKLEETYIIFKKLTD